jgi:hypothetical protein
VNIIFVEPSFPANQRRFVHALASVGANVYGIGESEEGHLGEDVLGALRGYYRVGSVTDVGQMVEAVRYFQDKVWIDGLEATVEAHTMTAALAAVGTPASRRASFIDGLSRQSHVVRTLVPGMSQASRTCAAVMVCASTVASSPSIQTLSWK